MTLLSPMPITSCEQVRPICLALAHPPIEPRLDSTIFDTADFRLCRRSPFIASQCRGQPMPAPPSFHPRSTIAMSEKENIIGGFNPLQTTTTTTMIMMMMMMTVMNIIGNGRTFLAICFLTY